MSTQKDFYVASRRSYGSYNRFEKYEDAEAYARKEAYSHGEDHHIFQVVATAEAPPQVNEVKVTKL